MLVGGAQSITSSVLIAVPFLGFVDSNIIFTITLILGSVVLTSFTTTRLLKLFIK